MKCVVAASLMVCVAACHTAPRVVIAPSARAIGTFEYHANITGQFEETGTITIARDTVEVDANDEVCRRIVEKNISERTHNFDCTGAFGVKELTLLIDSNKPILSRWYATRTETRSRTVCASAWTSCETCCRGDRRPAGVKTR